MRLQFEINIIRVMFENIAKIWRVQFGDVFKHHEYY